MAQAFNVQNLGLQGAIRQVRELRMIEDKSIIFDFKRMAKVRSIGMVYFIAAVEEMKNRGWKFHHNSTAPYWNDSSYHAISYAKQIGFFNALGFDEGHRFGERVNSQTYCPILRISQKQLYSESTVFQEGIVTESDRLAAILTNDIPQARDSMRYLIREIMRNTFEHNICDHLWISAQRHNAEGTIEVGIADNAQGIRQVLSVNPNLSSKITSDELALKYAIKPGVSGNAKSTASPDTWANSGYGLYVTSQVLNRLGSFALISGRKCLLYCDGNIRLTSANYQGTAVRLQFNIDRVKNIDSNLIKDIIDIGQGQAKMDPDAVKVASTASQMI